jgi:hypothetical protein
MTNPPDLDLHLEPHFDGTGDRQPPTAQASVANPRRTTWTGNAVADRDRLPAT